MIGEIYMNHFEYHSDIEAQFIRSRGKKVMLNPTDWNLMSEWQKQGIPLHIAIRGIEKTFSQERDRSIGSLSFCSKAVDAEFVKHLQSHAGESLVESPVACGTCYDTKEVGVKDETAQFDWALKYIPCEVCAI